MIKRARALETLAAEEFDLVVIGGGITAAGVALDAAGRGLSVALVERRDFAWGASSRSSKLLDGGRSSTGEALAERDLMLKLAPRLVRPLELRAPTAGAESRPLKGCQVDDVRLVLTVLGQAERLGAVCANRLEAIELIEQQGRIAGVRVRDVELDGSFIVAAERVINATGAWSDRRLRARNGASPLIRRTHILLAQADVALEGAGVLIPLEGGGRTLAQPWEGRVLVGPIEREHAGDPDEARPLDEDVDALLEAVNAFFRSKLARGDVVAAFAGVGLRAQPEIHVNDNGAITVTGGELTTWRPLAKAAVDLLLKREGRAAPSRTRDVQLAPQPASRPSDRTQAHVTERYGPAAREVLAFAGNEPRGAAPIVSGHPDLLAEAAYAACREQARSVGDVLLRRTRLGLLAARELCDPQSTAPLRVAQAMAPELGWTERRVSAEVVAWAREARAEGLVVNAG